MRLIYLVPLSFTLLSACLFDDSPNSLLLSGETMGTTYNVVISNAPEGMTEKNLQGRIETVLTDVNGKMSNWDPNSEISLLNKSTETAPQPISPQMSYVLTAAQQVHDQSNGKFDITLGPVIELWGFGPARPSDPVPEDARIAEAMARVGQDDKLTLTDATLQKTQADVSINLSAIAKGYGVDRVAEMLKSEGISDYLVEIGGDLVTSGINPDGQVWSIGIERPQQGAQHVQKILSLPDLGMATSGDYRNYFEEDGVRYSHIIDPTTGRPVTHKTASVTVIADTAMMADAWATAMLSLGQQEGLQVADQHDVAAYFITREGNEFVTAQSDAFDALFGDK